MSLWQTVKRPPWRTLFASMLILLVGGTCYALWPAGRSVHDGRHDRGQNGLWMQHGWLGADSWFEENGKVARIPEFRESASIARLAETLKRHHITEVFPHLAPAQPGGKLAGVDPAQVERFLDGLPGVRVLPWIGGVLDVHCFPADGRWRASWVASVRALLEAQPRLAGVHVNIEPWPSGHAELLTLLDELRAAMPPGRQLSVAAYPPPTRFHPYPEVHWEEGYFRAIDARVDHVAVMMYDTALRLPKLYEGLLADWTVEVLSWTTKPVLLGLPAYHDAGVGYHDPRVENLEHGLRGIHAGLSRLEAIPARYRGVALYSDWEMDAEEWRQVREGFLRIDR